MSGVEASIACRYIIKGLTGSTANARIFCKSPRVPKTTQLSVVSIILNQTFIYDIKMKIIENIFFTQLSPDDLAILCYAGCRADRNTGVCADRCGVSRFFKMGE